MESGVSANRAVSALLFTNSALMTLDAYSTLNSSPWTAENFGADPDKAASCREYVRHAIIVSSAFAVASAFISGTWWPIVGSAVANGYLYWLYERALGRGEDTGTTGWGQTANVGKALNWRQN
jgi:hypothetical protein